MSKEAIYPEVLFARLTETTPDEYRELIAQTNYRQYLFIYSGKGSALIDGRIEPLLPGTTLSIPSQTQCKLQLDQKCDGIWIGILEEFLTSRVVPAIPAMAKPNSPFWNIYYTISIRRQMCGAEQRKIRHRTMSELLFAHDRLGMGSDPIVAGYMLLILFSPSYRESVANALTDDDTSHRIIANELVISFRQLIEKHYREHWNITEYCKHLGVTPRRLLLACKHATGKFPKTLLHERLMREARADLIYSSKSISEIAYGLGFESAAYFSRFYKRYAGVSPSENPRSEIISKPH